MYKRRMSNGAFLGVWCSLAAVFATLAITMEVLGNSQSYRTFFDTYLGRGDPYVVGAEGSDKWDTDYYGQTYSQSETASGNADAYAAAKATAERIEDEGIVLLKNKDSALPLVPHSSVTMLGKGSADPVYSVSRYESSLTKNFITPKKGLLDAGFRVNESADAFFSSQVESTPRFRPVADEYEQSAFFVGEVSVEDFDFSFDAADTGLVFISRPGAIGMDLSTDLKRDSLTPGSIAEINQSLRAKAESLSFAEGQHQLELTQAEKDMIDFSTTKFHKTVVVINSAAPMELASIENDSSIDAVLWVGMPGQNGFSSLGKVLSGAVNPSGKTPDIYPADFTLDPTFANFGINGANRYQNLDAGTMDSGIHGAESHFVHFEEGIYTGYRYYETAALSKGKSWYEDAVVYPFGYGLSYTSFSKSMEKHWQSQGSVYVEVTVKNTGEKSGKEVVQLYCEPPYLGGIEKSARTLVAWDKTSLLAPGESESVILSFRLEDVASYDYRSAKSWVLEEGDYRISVQENSHEISLDSNHQKLVTSIHLDEKQLLPKKSDDRAITGNLFDDVSDLFVDDEDALRPRNFSRADFDATFPLPTTEGECDASLVSFDEQTIAARLHKHVYEPSSETENGPTVNAATGMVASTLRGANYNDPAFDRLLNQLTDEDYRNAESVICNNAYAIVGIRSIGLSDADIREGAQGLFSRALYENVCLYPCQTVLAATFNLDLAEEMGHSIGEEALSLRYRAVGWYGPKLNVHRSPFSGSYGDSYSEDPLVCGLMGMALTSASVKKGLIPFLRNFSLQDQESFRYAHLCIWANEQAIRELYLRPFELVVKNAKTSISYMGLAGARHERGIASSLGVMTSVQYLGATWSGGNKNLLSELLRKQWGFEGAITTDDNRVNYMNPMQALLAGTDMEFTRPQIKDRTIRDTSNPIVRNAIRRAIKNIVYLSVNSNAMQFVAPGSKVYYSLSPWRAWFYVGEVIFILSSIASIAWIVLRMRRVKKESELIEN